MSLQINFINPHEKIDCARSVNLRYSVQNPSVLNVRHKDHQIN